MHVGFSVSSLVSILHTHKATPETASTMDDFFLILRYFMRDSFLGKRSLSETEMISKTHVNRLADISTAHTELPRDGNLCTRFNLILWTLARSPRPFSLISKLKQRQSITVIIPRSQGLMTSALLFRVSLQVR